MKYTVEKSTNEYVCQDIKEIVNSNTPWKMLKNKHILITGANGFIAYYLLLTLMMLNDICDYNIQISGLVRNEFKAKKRFGNLADRDDFNLLVQDVCDPIQNIADANFVIHAASQASAIQFDMDPVGTINANLIGTQQVLKFVVKSKAESTLFISSLKVYGAVHNGLSLLKEDNIGYINHISYKNCYAQGKRAAETLCASFSKQNNLDVKIVRPCYIYGASSLDDDRVWAQILANVVRRENILLKSNGAALRSFCYISDAVKAIFLVLLSGKNIYPYNISAEHSNIMIRDFAKKAVEAFPEHQLALSFENSNDQFLPERSALSQDPEILDNTRLKQLGWLANIDIPMGIFRSVKILELESNLFEGTAFYENK
jgi:nucleoside-diphosphate-sugar epimerase